MTPSRSAINGRMIDLLPLLGRAECDACASQVLALRSTWIPRATCSYERGFATLGCASYLDVGCSPDPERDYYERLRNSNALIREQFGGLIDRLRRALEAHLGARVETSEDHALPGFHIFWGQSLVAIPTPELCHFDTQYRNLRWYGRWGTRAPISVTVAVRLPEGGASIDLWSVTPQSLSENGVITMSAHEYARSTPIPSMTHWYQPGIMMVQRDLWLHRIGRVGSRLPTDYRITLQAHLLEVGNRWVLYW